MSTTYAAPESSGAPDVVAKAGRPRSPWLLPALGLNVLIASGTFLVAKQTLHEFPPLALAMFRFVLAAGLLWPMSRWMRPGVRIRPADRGRIVMLGILAVPLNQGLFLVGLQWASASHAALLYALTPAFVVMLGLRIGGARPGWGEIGGIALAFAGVALLLLQRGLHFDPHSTRGDVVVLLAVVAWAAYLLLGRDLTRRYGAMVVTAEALLMGTLIYLPLGLVALSRFAPGAVTTAGWIGVLYLAWLTSALNYVIWFWGLRHLKPATVAMLTNLQPIVAASMAWAFLHEPLPAGFAVSLVLVLGGVWLTQHARVVRAGGARTG
jgi:drug/metabolite transporter (DMT)-like permease